MSTPKKNDAALIAAYVAGGVVAAAGLGTAACYLTTHQLPWDWWRWKDAALTRVRDFSDDNWNHGVERGAAGVMVDADDVQPGDSVLVHLLSGAWLERKVVNAWGDPFMSGRQVFLEGEPLDPATVAPRAEVRLLRGAR